MAYLENLTGPSDLRNLSVEQLKEVAEGPEEISAFSKAAQAVSSANWVERGRDGTRYITSRTAIATQPIRL